MFKKDLNTLFQKRAEKEEGVARVYGPPVPICKHNWTLGTQLPLKTFKSCCFGFAAMMFEFSCHWHSVSYFVFQRWFVLTTRLKRLSVVANLSNLRSWWLRLKLVKSFWPHTLASMQSNLGFLPICLIKLWDANKVN